MTVSANPRIERKTFYDLYSLIEALQEIVEADDVEVHCIHGGLLTGMDIEQTSKGKKVVLR